MSVLYLDTARLGRTCAAASQAQLDVNRLLVDDPSLYCENLFRNGADAWPEERLAQYPSFQHWHGLQSLQREFAKHFSVSDPENVFLASRSVQLVRLASRTMFRACRNVLTCDMNWPHWQHVVADEAARSGQAVSVAEIHSAVFDKGLSAKSLVETLAAAFLDRDCDGIFLPAVTNLGIRLPISDLLSRLKPSGRLRFVLVDAAQSFCQLPEPSPTKHVDMTITGCHKWLGGGNPLGVAICGRPIVAEQFRQILQSGHCPELEDPLLRFSQQIGGNSVSRYLETVNVTPLFTVNAAIREERTKRKHLREQLERQQRNLDTVEQCVDGTPWNLLDIDESLRSGIMLLQSQDPLHREADCLALGDRFRERGVAFSSYPQGVIRISTPKSLVSNHAANVMERAFQCVA
ncbi:aminotransferase class V-fold PLP-dependent enzyme [Rhodopirellula bahusiensis]|uniref:aminotransferase class V-fold PLP-dependent enzyme n=1 Tax=Rhodopirellula bahusiensis TaxID=2014065 RepID=UPI001E5A101F|nr:aminotransferase class V-fold PLP-dependent enzyme [Rhodopirellula bahusiensis]